MRGIQYITVTFRAITSLIAFAFYELTLSLGLGVSFPDVPFGEHQSGVMQQPLSFLVALAMYGVITRQLAVYMGQNFHPSRRSLEWASAAVIRWTVPIVIRIGSSYCAGIAYHTLAATMGRGLCIPFDEILIWPPQRGPWMASLAVMYGTSCVVGRLVKELLVWACEPSELIVGNNEKVKRRDKKRTMRVGDGVM